MRTVLLVAFHFPPLTGSSGIQRTLRFAQYLGDFGWKPIVLTADPRAYETADPRTGDQIPEGCEVIRAPAFDAARHFSIAGRYPGFLAVPDRWASWAWAGSLIAARAARHHGADAIWSTYPIATAHLIGASASRRTGLPWIADFRDPMAQDGYPSEPARWRAYRSIERCAADRAAKLVFVTPGAQRMYQERYADVPAERFALIENGYDEAAFEAAEAAGEAEPLPPATRTDGPLVLLHSGVVYPAERDPTNLVRAVATLDRTGSITPKTLRLRFRAPVHGELITRLAHDLGVADYFEICPPVSYENALREMMSCDGLIAMQAANCNEQIPAKVYEYLRAGRPILGLADPAGDTGRLLGTLGCQYVANLGSEVGVTSCLAQYVRDLREDTAQAVGRSKVERFSRRSLAGELARMLDQVCSQADEQ